MEGYKFGMEVDVLHCTALHCTALHCTALYCTVLYCTVLLTVISILLLFAVVFSPKCKNEGENVTYEISYHKQELLL
jgi:hypothetical protein